MPKHIIILLSIASIFTLTGCSQKFTKYQLIKEMEKYDFSKDIPEEFRDLMSTQDFKEITTKCLKEEIEILPYEMTLAQFEEIQPEFEKCIVTTISNETVLSTEEALLIIGNEYNSMLSDRNLKDIHQEEISNAIERCASKQQDLMPEKANLTQLEYADSNMRKCIYDTLQLGTL